MDFYESKLLTFPYHLNRLCVPNRQVLHRKQIPLSSNQRNSINTIKKIDGWNIVWVGYFLFLYFVSSAVCRIDRNDCHWFFSLAFFSFLRLFFVVLANCANFGLRLLENTIQYMKRTTNKLIQKVLVPLKQLQLPNSWKSLAWAMWFWVEWVLFHWMKRQ